MSPHGEGVMVKKRQSVINLIIFSFFFESESQLFDSKAFWNIWIGSSSEQSNIIETTALKKEKSSCFFKMKTRKSIFS